MTLMTRFIPDTEIQDSEDMLARDYKEKGCKIGKLTFSESYLYHRYGPFEIRCLPLKQIVWAYYKHSDRGMGGEDLVVHIPECDAFILPGGKSDERKRTLCELRTVCPHIVIGYSKALEQAWAEGLERFYQAADE